MRLVPLFSPVPRYRPPILSLLCKHVLPQFDLNCSPSLPSFYHCSLLRSLVPGARVYYALSYR